MLSGTRNGPEACTIGALLLFALAFASCGGSGGGDEGTILVLGSNSAPREAHGKVMIPAFDADVVALSLEAVEVAGRYPPVEDLWDIGHLGGWSQSVPSLDGPEGIYTRIYLGMHGAE